MKFIYTNEFGGSVEFSADSPFKLTAVQGLSENTINVLEATAVNQIGGTLTSTKTQAKNIILTGDYYYKPERRMQLINTIIPGKTGKLRYINDDMDVYLEVTPSQSPTISLNPVIQDFQFELRASFPYWKESQSTTFEFTKVVSFFRFPRSFSSTTPWKISRFSKSIISNIRNESTQETGFTLTMEAVTDVPCPELLNIETQERIRMRDDFVLKAGERLVITTYDNNKRALLFQRGLSSSAYKYLSDDTVLFKLMPGDNIIRYGAAENYQGLKATIQFDKTIAGV